MRFNHSLKATANRLNKKQVKKETQLRKQRQKKIETYNVLQDDLQHIQTINKNKHNDNLKPIQPMSRVQNNHYKSILNQAKHWTVNECKDFIKYVCEPQEKVVTLQDNNDAATAPVSFLPNTNGTTYNAFADVNPSIPNFAGTTQFSNNFHIPTRESLKRRKKQRQHQYTNIENANWAKMSVAALLLCFCCLGIHQKSQQINASVYHHTQIQAERSFAKEPILQAHVKITKKKKMSFLKTIATYAKEQKKYKITPSLVIAQAALESSWGKSPLYTEANNAFGIKGSYYGKHMFFNTQEDDGGVHMRDAMFKKYPSVKNSIKDHNKLLCQNYLAGIPKNNYIAEAKALQKNGYATNPDYANEIMGVVKSENLTRFD